MENVRHKPRQKDLVKLLTILEETAEVRHVTSISSMHGPEIRSLDTGQRMPCFDRCQLTVTWMSNMKDVRYNPRLNDLVDILAIHEVTAGI